MAKPAAQPSRPANSTAKPNKHPKTISSMLDQDLIPGLPDHISHICLASLPPALLYKVSHSWRNLIYSPHFPPFLSLYALLSPPDLDDSLQLFSFDPISSVWARLPPPPVQFLLRHPSYLSWNLPIQSVTVAGRIVIVAGTAPRFLPALTRPLIFDPTVSRWSFGPEMTTPRRWCAAGTSRGSVYVASGIGSHYSSLVAKSVEKWDFVNSSSTCDKKFEEMRTLKDGRFSREAIEAIGYRGKLCMVNVKGDAVKEGAVYDTESDAWEEMGEGMVRGWRGPAASMAEEHIYAVDEKRGVLMRYSGGIGGGWKEIVECERLKGAEHMAAGGGRVCVVGRGGGITVVDVVAAPVRIWVVEVPRGFNVVGLHILPRINIQ
uniref:Uncharacterized protein n=1 Tax=Kalanchoe fedtschenkoi TaxID=63787 RepID=A0A7N0TU46_KALFE